MKYVNIEEVLPGSALGKAILSVDGQVLLNKGASLTTKHLVRLKKFGIQSLPLEGAVVKAVTEQAFDFKQQTLAFIEESARYIQGEVEWKKHVRALFTKVVESKMVKDYLYLLQKSSESLYTHSLMVGLISISLGVRHGLTDERIEQLVYSALFHDIGKVVSEAYNEADTLLGADHTWRGYNYLIDQQGVDSVVAHVALSHHENMSATGFPRKLAADSVHDYAKIVAIANTFDRLTHRREGLSMMKPDEACEFMLAFTGKRFNINFMNVLLHSVLLYPTGSQVILSNGDYGIVVAQNYGYPHRPIISILHSKGGMQNIAVETVNLVKMNTLFISDFIN
ncbi:HD domain-containing phosphohydrolase [Bacillus sp. JCM 19041]|uniref:HD-GYP domain-containing protein n=1 Tax=Bacillus sp. JCM 19041 TaxID=1460637 RepID=UPI0006D1F19F